MALDFGKVRTGIAVTDELQLIASGLTTVNTKDLIAYLQKYTEQEALDGIVVSEPKQMDGTVSESEKAIQILLKTLKRTFPNMPIYRQDERFTSKMAVESMVFGGMKKKKRQEKGMVDKISATLILQAYLDRI